MTGDEVCQVTGKKPWSAVNQISQVVWTPLQLPAKAPAPAAVEEIGQTKTVPSY